MGFFCENEYGYLQKIVFTASSVVKIDERQLVGFSKQQNVLIVKKYGFLNTFGMTIIQNIRHFDAIGEKSRINFPSVFFQLTIFDYSLTLYKLKSV